MTIAFRSAANAASTTCNAPSSVASGDILVAWVLDEGNHTITPPSGWTQIDNFLLSSSTVIRQAAFWKLAGGSEPSTYTWTITGSTYTEVDIAAYTGVDTSTPINAHVTASQDGSSSAPTVPNITTTVANCVLAMGINEWFGNAWVTADIGGSVWTFDSGVTSSTAFDMGSFHRAVTTATTYGGESVAYDSGLGGNAHSMIVVALQPASGSLTVSGAATIALAPAPGSYALTLYPNTVASTTLGTAKQLGSATGGTQTNGSATRPASTTLVEDLRGTTGTALSAIPGSPGAAGYLFESTVIEGNTIPAGNWVATVQFKHTTATWTGHLAMQVWLRSSGGSYTLLASDDSAANVSTTTSYVARSCTAVQSSPQAFATGDKIYVELYYHESTRPATGATLQWEIASTSTGLTTNQIVTPGYVVSGNVNGAATIALAAPASSFTVDGAATVALQAAGLTKSGGASIALLQAGLTTAGAAKIALSATLTKAGGASVALLAAGLTKAGGATLALKALGNTKAGGASITLLAAGLTRAGAAAIALKSAGLTTPGAATIALAGGANTKSAQASIALKALGLSVAGGDTIALKAAGLTTAGAATIALKAAGLTTSAQATIAIGIAGTSKSGAATIALKALGATVSGSATLALKALGNSTAAQSSIALLKANLTKAAQARIALSATLTRAAGASLALKAAGLSISAGAQVSLKATLTCSAAATIPLIVFDPNPKIPVASILLETVAEAAIIFKPVPTADATLASVPAAEIVLKPVPTATIILMPVPGATIT